MDTINPVALIVIAFFTVIGALLGETLWGLFVGIGLVLLATFLDRPRLF